ncbi:MAG TPA: diguanylate cyclase [Thermoleophilaceae bacterium]|jgi:diguanylate cyclase (GGDEF)-like protein/PAS domain S-box-containing protein
MRPLQETPTGGSLPATEQDTDYRELVERIPAVSYTAEFGSTCAWHFVSPQVEQLLGYSVEEWTSDPGLWFRLVHEDDREAVLAAEARTYGEGVPFSCEYRLLNRSGNEVWVRDDAVVLVDEDGGRVLQGIMLDITAQKRAEERLLYLADHDPLTGLFNRRRFFRELDGYLAWSERHGDPGAVLLLDVDRLKEVNDSLGHEAGDELLKHVAVLLLGRVRQTDAVARLGGDEFVVLLRGVLPAQARDLAREIPELLAQTPVRIGENGITASTSVGIALIESGRDQQADSVVREADASMYRSKAGRTVGAAARDPEGNRMHGDDARSADNGEPASELEALLLSVEQNLHENSRIRDELRDRYGKTLPNFVATLLAQMDEQAARALHTLGRVRADGRP